VREGAARRAADLCSIEVFASGYSGFKHLYCVLRVDYTHSLLHLWYVHPCSPATNKTKCARIRTCWSQFPTR
jgi:hypothetical protein